MKLKFFIEYYKEHKLEFLLVEVGSLIGAVLGLVSPIIIHRVMDEVLEIGISQEIILMTSVLMMIYLANYYINRKSEEIGRSMGAKIELSMREKLFRHILRMNYKFFDNANTGQLISRLMSDIGEVGNLMFEVPHLLITSTITIIGSMIILIWMNWQLALVLMILIIIKIISTLKVHTALGESFRRVRENVGELSGKINESLQGSRLVKTLCTQEYEISKMLNANEKLLLAQTKSFSTLGKLHAGVDFFSNVINLAIIVIGGILISFELMKISDLVTFLLYMMICMQPIFHLLIMSEVYQGGMAGVKRYQELMDLPESNEVSSTRKTILEEASSVEFSNVNFAYDNDIQIFKNFNLKIRSGEHIGIVGKTGSGKTTLCELLLNLYEIDSGEISINGHDIKNIQIDNLRREVGIIQQDTFLFSTSIRENIAYGRAEASEEEIIEAAKLAEADEFIRELPHGYDTFIGERGVKLSGGQQQRIAIARMFLCNPKILILDEATSALDNETERQIQRAMDKLIKNRTTITVAHRLATIRNSDRIIVLEHGNIIEEGTHEELMELRGIYYNLSTSVA